MQEPTLPPPPSPSRAWSTAPSDPPRPWTLVKALTLAVFAGLIAGLLAVFVLLVLWGVFFVGARMGWMDEASMDQILLQGRWVAVGVATALTIWAGGYGASAKGSGPRIAAALGLGLPVGFGLAALGSDFWTLAGIGVGWAIAIPGRNVRLLTIRAAVPALLGLLAVGFSVSTLATEILYGIGGTAVAGVVVVAWIGLVEPALGHALETRADPPLSEVVDAAEEE